MTTSIRPMPPRADAGKAGIRGRNQSLKDRLADGLAEGVTEQGLVQSAGPNVQLASTSLQGRPVRRWRRGHALAGAPMGNSWLRGRQDGNVSVSGCGEPIPPPTAVRSPA